MAPIHLGYSAGTLAAPGAVEAMPPFGKQVRQSIEPALGGQPGRSGFLYLAKCGAN